MTQLRVLDHPRHSRAGLSRSYPVVRRALTPALHTQPAAEQPLCAKHTKRLTAI